MTNKNFENAMLGENLNVSKMLLDDKLSLNWSNNVMSNKINDDSGEPDLRSGRRDAE